MEGLQIATSLQIALAAGVAPKKARAAIKPLFEQAYLDRLTCRDAPPIYSPGDEGRRYLRIPKKEWSVPAAFRAVTANHLCLTLGVDRWELDPGLGLDARMEFGGKTYSIVCPRTGELEEERCVTVVSLLPENDRIIIVAVSRNQAVNLASLLAAGSAGRPLRLTWDTELHQFYRLKGKNLVPAENFSQKTLDRKENICYSKNAVGNNG